MEAASLPPQNQLHLAYVLVLLSIVLIVIFSLDAFVTAVYSMLYSSKGSSWKSSEDNERITMLISEQKNKYNRLILKPEFIKRKKDSKFEGIYRVAIRNFQPANSLSWVIKDSSSSGIELPNNSEPLLCFVNSKSGGNQGLYIRTELKKLLHPAQIVDVSKVNPKKALDEFSKLPAYKVLVCGGDGTVGWILNCLSDLSTDSASGSSKGGRNQPIGVAILPIGTGNDLAIELGWGQCYMNEPLVSYLEQILHSEVTALDRWEMKFFALSQMKRTDSFDQIMGRLSSLKTTTSSSSTSSSDVSFSSLPFKKKSVRFQNYCGIGVDAQIVLQFHEMRNENPHIFFHRWVNKLWYGLMGWEQIWKKSCAGFKDMVGLYVDGRRVAIPDDCEGIVLCNILSYGGGSKLWVAEEEEDSPTAAQEEGLDGQRQQLFEDDEDDSLNVSADERHRNGQHWLPSCMSDGLIEILAVRGSLELAQVRLGLANCRKLAQGREIYLQIWQTVPIQTDGEPWVHSPRMDGNWVRVQRSSPVAQAMMLRPNNRLHPANRDVLEVLQWAERTKLIDSHQYTTILEEYRRRSEQ